MSEYQFTVLLTNFVISSIPGIVMIIHSIKKDLLPLGIVGWLTSASIGTACAMIFDIPGGLPTIITAAVFFGIIHYSKKPEVK